MISIRCLILCSLTLASPLGFTPAMAAGTGLLGADTLIRSITKILNEPLIQPAARTNEAVVALLRDWDAFQTTRDTLTPDDAARRWLALFDRSVRLPPSSGNEDGRGSWRNRFMRGNSGGFLCHAVAALPPPSVWQTLHDQIMRRPPAEASHEVHERFLRMLSSYLLGDTVELKRELSALVKASEEFDSGIKEQIASMLPAMAAYVQDLEDVGKNLPVIDLFKARLDMLKKFTPASIETVLLPDLVELAGTNEASRLIRESLCIPKVVLTVPSGRVTRELARHLALEQVEKLLVPQWELTESLEPEAQRLYEALERKFAPQAPRDTSGLFASLISRSRSNSNDEDYNTKGMHAKARGFYALAMFVEGRTNEAAKAIIASSDGGSLYEFMNALNRASRDISASMRLDFLTFVQKHKPDAELWGEWMAAAMQAGQTNRVVPLLREAESKAPRDAGKRHALYASLVRAWLAIDGIDEAVRLIEVQLSEPAGADSAGRGSDQVWNRAQRGLQLATLGKLLNRPQWITRGIGVAIETAKQHPDSISSYNITSIVDVLLENQEEARAELLVLDALTALRKKQADNESGMGGDDPELASYLAILTRIYHHGGRHADVVALLDNAPWWGVPDLVQVNASGCGAENFRAVVAASLHAVGRDEDARRILKDYLQVQPADDLAFATLVAIEGTELIPWIDGLYARDRFEERPLIWKAVILQKAGRLDEAETVIRQALKVDPTDGETKAGDRVRAYGVLADIMAAKGKADDAAFMRNVVKSVRIAEKGDDLTQAGLVLGSLPVYEEAQGLFADAYCIQWRLAERLVAKGDFAGAEKHYRIAFERMPEQFGQVASLCFGCEGVFKSSPSQSTAERVLKDLVSRGPVRPQVYYLLGQLREAQERWPEAYEAYAKASELDPAYLDALRKRYCLGSSMLLPRSEQDILALRLIAMDPLGKHAGVDYSHIQNARSLWAVISANQSLSYTPLKELLVLPASKRQLESKKTGSGSLDSSMRRFSWMSYDMNRQGIPTPGEALLKLTFIERLMSLVGSDVSSDCML